MRSYCGLYVDAGYLLSAASVRVTGTSLRAATDVDAPALVRELVKQVQDDCGLPLLRVYWYDAAYSHGQLDEQQLAIASMPQVKLRLGRRGLGGEQKGVDLRLGLDLVTQARNRVVDVAYLISGDDDLTEAVEEAQHLGVQVSLLVVGGADGRPISVARNLHMASDGLQLIGEVALEAHVRKPSGIVETKVTPLIMAQRGHGYSAVQADGQADRHANGYRMYERPVYSSVTPGLEPVRSGERSEPAITAVVDKLVASWYATATQAELAELRQNKPTVPPELDRSLLQDLSSRLEVYELSTSQRRALRDAFWHRIDEL
jgi:uncharacterized LabA/DUF88 family protein